MHWIIISCLVIGSAVSFALYKLRFIPGIKTPAVAGGFALVLYMASWFFVDRAAKSDMFPRYRIVTDGKVYELETQYYPFSDWSRSQEEYPSVEAINEYLEDRRVLDSVYEEHRQRSWEEVK